MPFGIRAASMFSYKPIRYGAVVQPGLGRQIVNLEVAGSNPVGPATFPGTVSWDVNPRPGAAKGVCPLRGEHTRGLAPSVGAGEARFSAELATERGSNPVGPATFPGTASWDVSPRPGAAKGVCPLRGEHTRGLAPSVGAGEARFSAELATERGSNPVDPATFPGRLRCSLCRAGLTMRKGDDVTIRSHGALRFARGGVKDCSSDSLPLLRHFLGHHPVQVARVPFE